MGDLQDICAGWDQAAKEDAMFNILTTPGKDKDGEGWDHDEFFDRGVVEIEAVLARLATLNLDFGRARALDFGCGVGRLTQALADHFKYAVGIDVSPEMVRQAKLFAEERGVHRVGFRVNGQPNLSVFKGGSMNGFDFVYSVITLQHMPQDLQRSYVGEFIRVLRKNGVACFQIPEHNGDDLIHDKPWLSMFGTARETVERWVSDAEGRVVDVEVSEHGGTGWNGWMYTVTKA